MEPIETVAVMPSPPEVPLYVSVKEAAALAGVSYERMSAWANASVGAIPHINAGSAKKLIRVAAIPEYARTKEGS